jgi:ABC-type branched-subunit amino acid transport system substrate-binding protein
MGKKVKNAKNVNGNGVSASRLAATDRIKVLAPQYGITLVNKEGREQVAVMKELVFGGHPEVRFTMWADNKDGNRVLAVLNSTGDALSVKYPADFGSIRSIKC